MSGQFWFASEWYYRCHAKHKIGNVVHYVRLRKAKQIHRVIEERKRNGNKIFL